MTEDYFKNFAMMIPADIERHPDGTAISGFTDMEEKEKCRNYLASIVTEEQWQKLSGAEKEKMISEWRKNYEK